MKIYVAGKYGGSGGHETPSDERLANTMKAIEAGRELLKMGHNPYIPHLSHFLHEGWGWEGSTPELWYEIDLEWLANCDAILMLDNWTESHGAEVELDQAIQWHKLICYSLEEVPLT